MACAGSTEKKGPEATLSRRERFGEVAYDPASRRLRVTRTRRAARVPLADEIAAGLDAPICLTWELTYGCNLSCSHCLSSSGRRDPRELTTGEALALVDELAALRVFYVNVGGGEPTLRRDLLDIVEHATDSRVGVKLSTNGTTMTATLARRLAAIDLLDVQVSVDGAGPASNDAVRGAGSFHSASRAMRLLAEAGLVGLKMSVVVTRLNAGELEALRALAAGCGAQLRLTRLRPSGRGAASWHHLRPTGRQLEQVHRFLAEHPDVLTGDSFFHLGPLGPLPGLNTCGAGRVVCLVDPVGDVYACPFVMHPDCKAGSVREPGGLSRLWREAELFARLRTPGAVAGACGSCAAWATCRGGCMAAKFFTGLDLAGPDPECVLGHGEAALEGLGAGGGARPPGVPVPSPVHSGRAARRRSSAAPALGPPR